MAVRQTYTQTPDPEIFGDIISENDTRVPVLRFTPEKGDCITGTLQDDCSYAMAKDGTHPRN